MKNCDIKELVLKQLSIDMNCDPEDFGSRQNKVVPNRQLVGRRRFFTRPRFCHIACFGSAAVAVADERIHDFLRGFMEQNQEGYSLFTMPQLSFLNEELFKFHVCVGRIPEYFLPDVTVKPDLRTEFDIKVLSENDIRALCQDKQFSNAIGLGSSPNAERRDVLAAVGYHDGRMIGVAGASNDTDSLWQIGIDVVPEFRGLGVASVLTGTLREEILARGKIPYYGVAWSNIASIRTALRCGFKPAWVEMQSVEKA